MITNEFSGELSREGVHPTFIFIKLFTIYQVRTRVGTTADQRFNEKDDIKGLQDESSSTDIVPRVYLIMNDVV